MTAAAPDDAAALLRRVAQGDRRALARALTRAEAGDADLRAELDARGAALRGAARRVGFTGPPGAGKSSLVAALVGAARARGETVAVLAVDPSSPGRGGAFLGDRVRFGAYALDDGVFFRSQASRGAFGGLAETTPDLVDVLAVAPFDRLFLETVGVGQSELEVARLADRVVVVLSPYAGDVMQAMKSGLVEIGDRFVINKSDLPGAAQARDDLVAGLELAADGPARAARVRLASARTGEGVESLLDELDAQDVAERDARRAAALERRLDAATARALARLREAPAAAAETSRLGAALRRGEIGFGEAVRRSVETALKAASEGKDEA